MEQESEVEKKYGKVQTKRIIMKDETAEGQITLWCPHATDDTTLGGFYKICHFSTSKKMKQLVKISYSSIMSWMVQL